MARTTVVSRNFNADANGAFPAGFTDLNSFNGVVTVANPSGSAGSFKNDYGNPADARDTGTFSADQYAKITISGFSGSNANDQVGVCLRLGTATVGGAGVNGYRIKVTDGGVGARTIRAYSVVNGVETQIGPTVTMALVDNDELLAEIIGSLLSVYINAVPLSGLTAVNTTTHATGNPGIMPMLGSNATMRGDNYEAGNVTAESASDISGNATIDEPSAGGGMESAAELSGNATVDEPGAGGGMSSAGSSEISGNATIDEPGAGGGMASAAEISGNATVDEPSAGGGMSGSGGTLTSGDLKDNGTGVHSNAPFEARVYAAGDGSLVVRKTALTSTTSATAPTCSFLDAAVVTGQQYYVQWIRTDTGQYGIELLTAT